MHHSNFVHLHLHTQYSLLDGAIRPAELVALAREYKMPAVAITDHGNLFGAVEFYQKAMSAGIKPIIGCEMYVAPGKHTDKSAGRSNSPSEGSTSHLVLLVKNAKGYQNLCKLLSIAYIDGFYYKPRIDKDLLREHNEGLIAMSACLHGEVSKYLSMGMVSEATKAAQEYKEIFSNRRFYLELQSNGLEEQKKVNLGLIEISKKLDIPLVATNDCHYLRKTDAGVHDILLCIQTGTTVNTEGRMKFQTDELYFKSPEEMSSAFKDVPSALANTIEIAERCNFEMKLGENHLPDFPMPEGETLDSLIEAKAISGLEERLKRFSDPEALRWQYHDRLLKELKVIKGMGFSGYFLIVADFIDYAKSQNIPVGPGRGSAAGSLVAYALGITNLDPIRYNLLFERFLNPDRISLPDIDIDFCFEERDRVIKYVTEKYGSDNVTQIITFGQMKAKACIRDVGRALDMPYGDVDKIAKLVPNQLNITLEKALEIEPRLKKLVNEDPKVARLMDAARALEGLPRHASTHAAGVVISNKPLVEYLPLYKGQKENIITTQYSMKDVEKIGLVKFDFLGLKTLTVIDKALKLIAANRSVRVDLDELPLDDSETYALLAAGNTDGVFQLEGSGLKELLKKLKPGQFEDIVAAVALYRPGPLQSGMVDDFINRKHGRVPIQYDLPQLKDILENTYGVMVYQEQVMEIAKVLAGYTPGDADVLRKAMGKKLPEEMVHQRNKFIDGAKKKSVPQKKAEKIFDLMAKFAGYGFNKSHSAAYALVSYQTAYLKAHFPVEFMAALLGSDMDNTDQVVKYINGCREAGIGVQPPDINESAKEFTVKGDKIRFGLAAIKNVGSSAIDEIISARTDGPFASLVDFLGRLDSRKVNRKVVESLIKCGAFDSVSPSRSGLFASLDMAMESAQSMQRDREAGQQSIFDVIKPAKGAPVPKAQKDESASVPQWGEKERLQFEKETLGFYFSSHPLESVKNELERLTTCFIERLTELADETEVSVGGVIVSKKEISTKKGDRMAFIRVEDMTGGVEVVVFADLYKKAMPIIESDSPVVVSGRLDKDEEDAKLIASEILLLDDAVKQGRKVRQMNTHIFFDASIADATKLEEIRNVISANPGPSQVYLHLLYPEKEFVIAAEPALSMTTSAEAHDMIKGVLPGVEIRVV